MTTCPWRSRIDTAYAVERWIDTHPIAALLKWDGGEEFLWIDGRICTLVAGAMPPIEIIRNLENLAPDLRAEAIEGLKAIATVVQRAIDERKLEQMLHGKFSN